MESASGTDVETQSSTVDPLEDAYSMEQVLARRWQCDLCNEGHGQPETPWQLGDGRCGHSFCRRCILGCIRWGGRCPYDNTPIPQIVVCGAMGTGEYVYHEKSAEARRSGGLVCAESDCPGVAPPVDGPAQPTACSRCGARRCSRRVCGSPWTDGHRCWDVVEEQRRRAEQDIETRLRHPNLDPAAVETSRRLAAAPRFRPCPQCGAMVEHDGGCNMVHHDSCGARWCFVCRRIGSCSDFDCRSPGSAPPTPRMSPAQRGPTTTSTSSTSSAKKVTSILMTVASLFICLVSLLVYGLVSLQMGVPRNGFLGSSATPGDSCAPGSCDSASPLPEQAAAVRVALQKLDA